MGKYEIKFSKEELLAFDKFCSYFPKTELEQKCPQVLKDKSFLTFLGKLYQHINKIRGVTEEEQKILQKKAKKFLGLR
jgi:hypothetical protein